MAISTVVDICIFLGVKPFIGQWRGFGAWEEKLKMIYANASERNWVAHALSIAVLYATPLPPFFARSNITCQ